MHEPQLKRSIPLLESSLHGEAIVLYGAGSVGRDVYDVLQARGHAVQYFLDARADQSFSHRGIPTVRPDSTDISSVERESALVIVSIFNRDVFIPAVVGQLHDLGWRRVVTLYDVFPLLATELGDRFWLTDPTRYAAWRGSIENARTLWADEESRSLFDRVIRFRLTGDSALAMPDRADEQYFPSGIVSLREPVRMIDCGAYTGDTVLALVNSALRIDAVAAFEPDPLSFSALVATLHDNQARIAQRACWPCATWSKSAQMAFQSGNGEGSALSLDGSSTIPCVALDDVVPDFRPTLIKMDIEGAELETLAGARNLIIRSRPDLAICVYHRPEHLWEIPAFIAQLELGYSLFLRAHAYNGFELVLYARTNSQWS